MYDSCIIHQQIVPNTLPDHEIYISWSDDDFWTLCSRMYIFWQLMNNLSKLFESFCQQHFFVNACVLVCRYWQAAGRRERRSNQCWTDPASWQTHKRLPASWSLYKTLFVDPKPKIYAWLFSATALRIQICSDEQKAHWELTFLADTEWTKNL